MNVLILLGGLLSVFLPGFLASLVMYPREDDLDFWKRIGVSFGLGVLVVVYSGFILAKFRALSLEGYVGMVLISCGILGMLAVLRGGMRVIVYYTKFIPKLKDFVRRGGEGWILCPKCGHQNKIGLVSCRKCGARL